MSKSGLGKEFDCLIRKEPLQKSAFSPPDKRPKPEDQFRTLEVKSQLAVPQKVLLVDDIVTSGATALGAASRIQASFPGASISLFAMMRRVDSNNSSPFEKFRQFEDPCFGVIIRKRDGRTWLKVERHL